MTRIEAIKQRLAAATDPGSFMAPWQTDGKWEHDPDCGDSVSVFSADGASINGALHVADASHPLTADLIAHAPQDLRDLLELYEAIKDADVPLTGSEDYNIGWERVDALLSRLDAPVNSDV